MQLAVLSDIHGNLPALEAVLKDLEPLTLDGMIVAGDFIGGPQPNETIQLLRAHSAWMIQGNSDDNILRFASGQAPTAWQTSRQWALTRWNYQNISSENLAFLAALPHQRVVSMGTLPSIRVVHGSHRHPAESLLPNRDPNLVDLIFSEVQEPVFVCGHTHISWQIVRCERLAFNPGAVCGPLNGYVGAEYSLLEWQTGRWHVELRQVSYDLREIRRAFHLSGLLQEGGALARSFLRSIETGQNVAEDFLSHAYRLAAEAGHPDCDVVPDMIWDEAAETFDW
jgi:putative phosphoesterase